MNDYSLDAPKRMIPILRLNSGNTESIVFNIYLKSIPSPAQNLSLIAALEAWYTLGREGAYGGRLRNMSGLALNGSVVRGNVEMRVVDEEQAIQGLQEHLVQLQTVSVESIVIGIEKVG